MSIARYHNEWLTLVPNSGPFLSLPVLSQVFPQGLNALDPEHSRRMRQAFGEWDDDQAGPRPDATIHRAWIRFVLAETLGFDELLAEGQAIPQTLKTDISEHGETLRPDWIVNDPTTQKARLLVQTYPRAQSLTKPMLGSRWKASPDTRMMQLLHDTSIRLGLVTNGDHWMLVNAPKNETSGYVSWYANLWLEEPIALRAFRTLLCAERFFGVQDTETIEALLDRSADDQQEVTDQLGYQVRKAVEVLIQSLDKADEDHGRKLLADVNEKVLYEAALTVMMRLVFLFCAEERELLLLGDDLWDKNYAVSTLREQLRTTADQHGEEILGLRFDAWPRLLTTFRAVYGGVKHDRFKLPAYGGSLFNPDRFPFLEGRKKTTNNTNNTNKNKEDESSPSSDSCDSGYSWFVNNRTVLHLLEALQVLQVRLPGGGPAEARKLSFRELDIEQIGHVYEGLLDHTAKRATEPVLGLQGTRDKEPEIPLAELEREAWGVDREAWTEEDEWFTVHEPRSTFWRFLKDKTGRSESALKKGLDAEIEDQLRSRFRTVCQDSALWKRVQKFAGLVRLDTIGYPVVITEGSVFVTAGTDRRSSGTHYTPKSLTEPIVQYTLEPLVYDGPAEGLPKHEWKLRSAKELLDLKICDMACGSGAFLVQACRYLAERLMEAWDETEREAWTVNRGPRGINDGSTDISRFRSVEGGDGPGSRVLSGDEGVSEGRIVRDDKPDSPCGSLDSSEHRRGPGTGSHEGVPELPEHRQGIVDGGANAPAPRSEGGTPERHRSATPADSLRTNQPDALPPAPSAGTEALKRSTVHGSRSTVHGSRSTFVPRITPHGSRSTGLPSEQLVPIDTDERQTYALRIVAQRCLYGVDMNPLAVEMAKLSLWLLTLAKEKPFEFLDHAIRHGDSLVGVHDFTQLERLYLDDDATQTNVYQDMIRRRIDAAVDLRRKIENTPAGTVEEIETQEMLLRRAEREMARLRCGADLLTAEAFGADLRAWSKVNVFDDNSDLQEYQQEAARALAGRTTFHWPLEFPEVFQRQTTEYAEHTEKIQKDLDSSAFPCVPRIPWFGFDALVCNPPFMGGKKITGNFGNAYREYLVKWLAGGQRGSADLCAYFFLRAAQLLREGGQLGFLATNTIAQGDTREVGLEQLTAGGCVIPRAVPSRPWPGAASLEVAHVWLRRGAWKGPFLLDDKTTNGITAFLTPPGVVTGNPYRLKANEGKSFQGSIVLGMGFVLEPEEAHRLIDKDARNKDVLFPYLNGEDLNSRPDQSPSRWVINFFDWPIDKAREYPDCFRIIEEKVKPERTRKNDKGEFVLRKPLPHKWWIYADKRPELYRTIAGMERVLVRSRVANINSWDFTSARIVNSEATVIVADNSCAWFALMQNSFQSAWIAAYASSMRTDVRYTPSDCFETFPFPSLSSYSYDSCDSWLNSLGERYHEHRRQIMLARQEGLTKTYNRFHNADEDSIDIVQLRQLHVEMDCAVAAAYGWTDLDLGHGFHQTKQGIRYTIGDAARREVLARLLTLNHERYAAEVKQGLHEKKKPRNTRKTRKKTEEGGELFG